jgi:dihydrodipicolinate synthase/N-acetylneuraminate lyase
MVHQIPDPFVAPRGLVDYVRRIADAPDGLPIVLYLRNESKTALQLAGIDCGAVRPPSAWPLAPAAHAQLLELLESGALQR